MSTPQEFTVSTEGPECPQCGNILENDGDYTYYGNDGDSFDIECYVCDLKYTAVVHVEHSWHSDHPMQCGVKGYHVPYINETFNKHECLYCKVKLTCKCTLHDRCKHRSKALVKFDEQGDTK